MTSYFKRSLYGGAITVELPSFFVDVSDFRQVPDHQEVFLDNSGFTSIIFDITERVGSDSTGPDVDCAALTAHLEDITEKETVQVWNTNSTQFSKLPEGIPAYTLIATPIESSKNPKNSKFTAILLTLVRLEKESTDILITINVPHEDTEDIELETGKLGKLIDNSIEYTTRIWQTFEIHNWNLFNDNSKN
ncbi:putative ran guanine nucleotide release factor [Erysiphe necator]|uniref:Putative ran-interacting mog1 protein n=1 Tax=Uncinula necator TaxID=52586 RepID=A0A0B1P9J2_UNCNE|nr:putative ran guanine nucleotide release factor [Erysiphe necator]KHJ34918.1 putative ran-interacting mog1 protein [Erysiphe necator]